MYTEVGTARQMTTHSRRVFLQKEYKQIHIQTERPTYRDTHVYVYIYIYILIDLYMYIRKHDHTGFTYSVHDRT